MKKIGAWRLALVYAGCFLGAGYLSGQELWQFFGVFGRGGIWGLTLCTVLQAYFCVILMSLVRRGNLREIGQVTVRRERRSLRGAVGGAQLILLLGVGAIMAAGVGALTEQLLGGGRLVSSLLLCGAVAAVALRGMRGLVAVFSYSVPILITAAVLTAAWAGASRGWTAMVPWGTMRGDGGPLLAHWTVSAVCFVSYNLFGSIAVLVPLAREISDVRTVRRGAVLGAAILLTVAAAILFALNLFPETFTAELPMLALAQRLHPAAGWMFALLLLIAMFCTALSCTVAVREYLLQKYATCARHPTAVVFAVSAIAFAGGMFGFGDLIGWVYPIFGYLGFVALCSMVAHERYVRRMEKKKEKP